MALIAATYISATSFSLVGDQTSIMEAGRRLRLDCGTDGIKVALVVSAVFTTVTTVTISGVSITANLLGVQYGIASPSSLPKHSHDTDDIPAFPVLSWIGDRLAINGVATGPSLSGSGSSALDADPSTIYGYTGVGNLVRKMLASDCVSAKVGSVYLGGTGSFTLGSTVLTASGGKGAAAGLIDNSTSTYVGLNTSYSDVLISFNYLSRVTSINVRMYNNSQASGYGLYVDYMNSSGTWVNICMLPTSLISTTCTQACDVICSAIRLRHPFPTQECRIYEMALDVQVPLLKYIRAVTACPILGIATSATSVTRRGEVTITGKTWTVGARLYAAADGSITETYAPTLQCIGIAIAADIIKFEPDCGVIPTGTFATPSHSHAADDLPATMTPSAHTHPVSVATKTSAHTVTSTDDVLLCDATTAALVITLPLASAASTRPLNIKKIDAGVNVVTINAAGTDKIDGAAFIALGYQYKSVTIISNGTNWFII